MDPASRRTSGIAGVVFVALAVVIAILEGDVSWDDTNAELREFYDGSQQDRAVAAAMLLPLAIAAFLWFVAGVRSFLRAGHPGTGALPSAAALGGGVFAAGLLVAATANNLVPTALAFTDAYRFDPGAARLLLVLSIVLSTGAQAAAAVLVAATSEVGRRAGGLPSWFVWAGYVVAVLNLFSLLLFGWPIALFGVWVLVLSVLMLRRAPAATGELPGPRTEPAVTTETTKETSQSHDAAG